MRVVVPPCVVKLHVTADGSGVPSAALIVAASVVVYVVESASALLGVSVAVFVDESYDTDAAMGEPPLGASVKLDVVIVAGSIAREKVALTTVVVPTPVAPEAGEVDVTVG